MIVTTNIFCLPLLLVVWMIDGYLLLLLIRWILSRIPQTSESQLCPQLGLLTDPLPQWLGQQLQRIHHKLVLPGDVRVVASTGDMVTNWPEAHGKLSRRRAFGWRS